MSKYTKSKLIKELTDNETGEIKYYKEVKALRRTIEYGARLMYPKTLEDVLLKLSGKKEIEIFFYILDRPTSKKTDFTLEQKRLGKLFNTSQPYISRIINKFIKIGFLYKTQKKPVAKYRVNPYIYLPAYSNGVELQDEWDILHGMSKDKRIKDIPEYLDYLQSEEWKEKANRIKQRDNNKCTRCGSTEKLEVHHLSYDNIYNEPDEDLTTLCRECHLKEHEND
jgi:5-methylcytosine-specific restriction endonuclease McrA